MKNVNEFTTNLLNSLTNGLIYGNIERQRYKDNKNEWKVFPVNNKVQVHWYLRFSCWCCANLTYLFLTIFSPKFVHSYNKVFRNVILMRVLLTRTCSVFVTFSILNTGFKQVVLGTQSAFTCFKSTLKTPKQCGKSVQSQRWRHQFVLMSLLLILNKFHSLFSFLYCYLNKWMPAG